MFAASELKIALLHDYALSFCFAFSSLKRAYRLKLEKSIMEPG
jgi:hypothetical protein